MANRPPKELLSDPDVRRWYDNLRRSGALLCTVRLGRLNPFCDRMGMTPHGLASAGGVWLHDMPCGRFLIRRKAAPA